MAQRLQGQGLFCQWHAQSRASNNAAASLLSYDINLKRPWDFRVSLYTWTKSISSGVMLFMLIAVVLGFAPLQRPPSPVGLAILALY
ncbi:MAG: hypothetical protein R2865_08405 [Deinococcales bacterium]